MDNGKEVELTDDGRKYDIIYKTKRNNKTSFVQVLIGVIGFTMILIIILLIKTMIN